MYDIQIDMNMIGNMCMHVYRTAPKNRSRSTAGMSTTPGIGIVPIRARPSVTKRTSWETVGTLLKKPNWKLSALNGERDANLA